MVLTGAETVVLKPAVDIAAKTGLLRSLAKALFDDREAAVKELSEVIVEIRKILTSVTADYRTFVGIYFDPSKPEKVREYVGALSLFTPELMWNRYQEAHGSCKRIWDIYDNHLRGRVSSALQPKQKSDIDGLFNDLRSADSVALKVMLNVINTLSDQARTVLELVNSKDPDYEKANDMIEKTRENVTPMLNKIGSQIQKLQRLQNELDGNRGPREQQYPKVRPAADR